MAVQLVLTSAECLYAVTLSEIGNQPGGRNVTWRLGLIQAALTEDSVFTFSVGAGELWWLERVLLSGGINAKLPDGTRAADTLRKVWTALLDVYADTDWLEWPVGKDNPDGRDNEDED